MVFPCASEEGIVALIRHSCASTHMRTIDLMADLDLDDGDTKSDGFEFQTFFSLSDSPLGLCGAGVGFLDCSPSFSCDVPRQPHINDVQSSFYFFPFPDLSVILLTYHHGSQVDYTFDT